jgi:hypothetical protein
MRINVTYLPPLTSMDFKGVSQPLKVKNNHGRNLNGQRVSILEHTEEVLFGEHGGIGFRKLRLAH